MSDNSSHDFASLKGHMAKGALWMVGMRWSLRLIGLLNTLIIARLLTPDDFGVSTMAWIVVEFLMMLAETNVDIGVLRNNKFTRDYLDSAWTVKIISGVVIFVVLMAIAPLTELYYEDHRVPLVIQIVSLRALIMGFENIGIAEFRHKMEFAKEFRYWMLRRMLMLGFGLGLAFALGNYMALALAAPVSGALTVALSFLMSSYRPRISFVKWRELWRFSQWQLLSNATRYVNGRADQFVVGGIGDAADTGHYYVASDIAGMPTREVIGPMGRAFLPVLAKIVGQPGELRQAWDVILQFTALIAFPAGVGMALIADDTILVLLGPQWINSTFFFQWLALCALFEGFFLSMETLFIVNHHERTFALINGFQLLVLVPLLFAAGHFFGIVAIAQVRLVVMAITVVAMFALMIRLGWTDIGTILRSLWRPAVASAVMAVAVMAGHGDHGGMRILSLALDITLGAVVFCGVLFGLWLACRRPPGAEAIVIAALRTRVRRRST